MHSDTRVIKEARTQLKKADTWIRPALDVDGMDQELLERWGELSTEIREALDTWLEDSA